MEDLHEKQKRELGFYNFQNGDKIASIGAQCCHWEAAYAATIENAEFYLEDIDSMYFNQPQASFAWNYYDSLRNSPMTSSYKLVIGDEQKTNLPANYFDKVLIINSFHEFSYPKEMLEDIKQKLKPGGLLYIDEALARHAGELHGICKKKMYLSDELIGLLKQSGFEYVNGVDIVFRKKRSVRKIFAFRKIL